MAAVVVCGGGVVGLSLAMLLARDGHRVTVLERDAAGPAPGAEAWSEWARPGVAQFHQPHTLLARFRRILDEELPGMVERLEAAGCVWADWLAVMPPLIRDCSPRPGDDRFRYVTGRRPVVEAVLAGAAAETEGVDIRRGVAVAGLRTGARVLDGVPHVIGVRTTAGDDLDADLVVDATGRRSRLGEWLTAAGGVPPHVESEDCGFVYHNLRDVDRFTDVVRACPVQAHWLDGEPMTGVLTTAGVLDRYRRMVVDGAPVVTGLVVVGDAWACTNPSAGRGMTLGLLQAQCLRDVVRSHAGDPEALARAMDEVTEAEVTPYYRAQMTADRARFAEMDALRRGEAPAAPSPRDAAIAGAVMRDPDVFRAMLEATMCLARPDEVFSRPEVMEKVEAVGRIRVWKIPGPNRQALLELVGG